MKTNIKNIALILLRGIFFWFLFFLPLTITFIPYDLFFLFNLYFYLAIIPILIISFLYTNLDDFVSNFLKVKNSLQAFIVLLITFPIIVAYGMIMSFIFDASHYNLWLISIMLLITGLIEWIIFKKLYYNKDSTNPQPIVFKTLIFLNLLFSFLLILPFTGIIETTVNTPFIYKEINPTLSKYTVVIILYYIINLGLISTTITKFNLPINIFTTQKLKLTSFITAILLIASYLFIKLNPITNFSIWIYLIIFILIIFISLQFFIYLYKKSKRFSRKVFAFIVAFLTFLGFYYSIGINVSFATHEIVCAQYLKNSSQTEEQESQNYSWYIFSKNYFFPLYIFDKPLYLQEFFEDLKQNKPIIDYHLIDSMECSSFCLQQADKEFIEKYYCKK